MTKLKQTEVVRTVEVSPIKMGSKGEGELRFRVEILRSREGRRTRFEARVWRLEFYRIQPSFPQRDGQPSDHPSDEQIMMIEEGLSGTESGSSASAVLKNIIRKIEEKFLA